MADKPVYSTTGSGYPLYRPASDEPVYSCGGSTPVYCTQCPSDHNPFQVSIEFPGDLAGGCGECAALAGNSITLTQEADCDWYATYTIGDCVIYMKVVFASGGGGSLQFFMSLTPGFGSNFITWSLAPVETDCQWVDYPITDVAVSGTEPCFSANPVLLTAL